MLHQALKWGHGPAAWANQSIFRVDPICRSGFCKTLDPVSFASGVFWDQHLGLSWPALSSQRNLSLSHQALQVIIEWQAAKTTNPPPVTGKSNNPE
jgi:hypothetical protein